MVIKQNCDRHKYIFKLHFTENSGYTHEWNLSIRLTIEKKKIKLRNF